MKRKRDGIFDFLYLTFMGVTDNSHFLLSPPPSKAWWGVYMACWIWHCHIATVPSFLPVMMLHSGNQSLQVDAWQCWLHPPVGTPVPRLHCTEEVCIQLTIQLRGRLIMCQHCRLKPLWIIHKDHCQKPCWDFYLRLYSSWAVLLSRDNTGGEGRGRKEKERIFPHIQQIAVSMSQGGQSLEALCDYTSPYPTGNCSEAMSGTLLKTSIASVFSIWKVIILDIMHSGKGKDAAAVQLFSCRTVPDSMQAALD